MIFHGLKSEVPHLQYFYVWNFNKRKRFIGLIIISMVTFFILIAKPLTTFLKNEDKPAVLLKGSSSEKNIALTFNISWGEKRLNKIIDVLKHYDVQATFFISGEWAERHPEELKLIKENQHEIGMLGYRYKNYVEQDIDQVRKDLLYAREVFKKLDLEDVNLLRAPSGQFNKEIIELARSLNYEIVHWSVNTYDWKRPGVDEIVQRTLNETENGDIILMHASDDAKQTVKALDIILPALLDRDFKFISIPELINQVNMEKELIE